MSRRGSPLALAALAQLVAALGVVGAGLALGASPAHAGENDLVLSRLGNIVEQDGAPVDVVGQNVDFRSLTSELGVVLAPRLLAPSDTLGFGGFQFAADVGWTSISSDASFWRAREAGEPTMTGSHGSEMMPTVGVFARKGMWFPVPSIEVGAGMVHLLDSRYWTPQAYVKLAVVEGYHGLPIPSLAVRGAASRLMGSHELDLTVASFDLSASKHVGIGGTWSIDPYAGWNLLVIVPRSEVIDATPGIDPLATGHTADSKLDFVFRDQDDVVRNRFFVGAKLQYDVFALTLEGNFALAGSSVDDRPGDMACTSGSATEQCDATDRAAAQRTLTASVGLDF
jgi:hypothetical protein